MAAGRVIDAGLHLLDRQLVDVDGRLCGKVDDLELEVPDDGSLPIVVAVLTGPGVLATRVRGRILGGIGRLHEWVARGVGGGPSRIPFALVQNVDHHLTLAVTVADLDAQGEERWLRDHVITKLPGAGHAAG
jgi:hypothetical protein